MGWSRIRFVIFCAAVLVLGIPLIIFAAADMIAFENAADFAGLEAAELRGGMYVSGTVSELWGAFAAVGEGEGAMYYFALPLESTLDDFRPKFISIAFKNADDVATARKMAWETFYIADEHTSMNIVGKLSKLDGDALDYFGSYIEDVGGIWGWYADEVVCAFVVDTSRDGSGAVWRLISGAIITLIGLSGIVPAVVKKLRRK